MKRQGFSLLELLLVVTILGIIAGIIVARFSVNTDNAKDKVCDHHRAQINSAIERFRLETGAWPAADLSDIGADPSYFPEGVPISPVDSAPYVMNATTHRVDPH